jgi:hypothetical protein
MPVCILGFLAFNVRPAASISAFTARLSAQTLACHTTLEFLPLNENPGLETSRLDNIHPDFRVGPIQLFFWYLVCSLRNLFPVAGGIENVYFCRISYLLEMSSFEGILFDAAYKSNSRMNYSPESGLNPFEARQSLILMT